MGNFNKMFCEMEKDKDVSLPMYSAEHGHIILGGVITSLKCIFTIVADANESASLSVSGANAELIIPSLRDMVSEIVGAEPLCQYDVQSKPELHVIEWCTGVDETVYLIDLINSGGRYFRLQPKKNLVLLNDHDPQEYYSAEYAASQDRPTVLCQA